jgi:formamidopyrimidine-DNA glycosylase
MPELPEVETVVRELNRALPGHRIEKVDVFRKDALGRVRPKAFASALQGKIFGKVGRHGKFLLFGLEPEGFLVAHLRMTGKFILSAPLKAPDPHHRVWFGLEDGQTLVFQDMRCFGTLAYVDRLDASASLAKLGVDPYSKEFTAAWLAGALKQSKTPLKHWLMDQKHIAGLGNIYVCEVLFRTGMSPLRRAHRVTAAQAALLHREIHAVLDQAIRKNGTTISDFRRIDEKFGEFQEYLQVYGREAEPCPRCGAPILRIRQQQRSTFYCAKCQT